MKQKLYPSTYRVEPTKFMITEKLDGSNIGFFKLNGELIIAQRNNVYTMEDIEDCKKDDLYNGLYDWLVEHAKDLEESLYEGSGFFGEWIGMGRLKYDFENRVFIFAKANLRWADEWRTTYEIRNKYYDRKLFVYPFANQTIPSYLSIVPLVSETSEINIDNLDVIYDEYSKKVDRKVEGFVIIYNEDSIKKYVRMKSGSLEEHFW